MGAKQPQHPPAGMQKPTRVPPPPPPRKDIRQRYIERLPFCPDHRDKVSGKSCRECEIERLRSAVAVAVGWFQTIRSADGSGHADLGDRLAEQSGMPELVRQPKETNDEKP